MRSVCYAYWEIERHKTTDRQRQTGRQRERQSERERERERERGERGALEAVFIAVALRPHALVAS